MNREIVIPKVWRSEAGALIGFILTSLCSIYLSQLLPWTVVDGELFKVLGTPLYLRLPILWLIPSSFLGYGIFRIYDVRYSMDGQGLQTINGILALNQKIIRVRYEDIRSVQTHQGILDRLLDIGIVEIGTAATSQLEITFSGVSAPLEIHATIENEKEYRQRSASKYQLKR